MLWPNSLEAQHRKSAMAMDVLAIPVAAPTLDNTTTKLTVGGRQTRVTSESGDSGF